MLYAGINCDFILSHHYLTCDNKLSEKWAKIVVIFIIVLGSGTNIDLEYSWFHTY